MEKGYLFEAHTKLGDIVASYTCTRLRNFNNDGIIEQLANFLEVNYERMLRTIDINDNKIIEESELDKKMNSFFGDNNWRITNGEILVK